MLCDVLPVHVPSDFSSLLGMGVFLGVCIYGAFTFFEPGKVQP